VFVDTLSCSPSRKPYISVIGYERRGSLETTEGNKKHRNRRAESLEDD